MRSGAALPREVGAAEEFTASAPPVRTAFRPTSSARRLLQFSFLFHGRIV